MVRRAWLVVLAVLLVACGGGTSQPDTVTWRNVTLDVPDGWYLVESEDTRLSIANRDIRVGEDGQEPPPDGDVVGMFFTYEPRTLPADWRAFVQQQGATLESDEQITVGDDVPATRLVFSYTTNDIPTREMVVLIPSRAIVVIAQPIPGPGETDAPEVFLRWIETFQQVLQTAEYGAPVMD